MKASVNRTLPAILLMGAAAMAFAGTEDGSSRFGADLLGVFRPETMNFSIDPQRCPDASHPLLAQITGTAHTNLGTAPFVQSHCEDFAHTSFRRGQMTLTTSSGDQLFGTYKGQLVASGDGIILVDGHYEDVGGTGTLANSHGNGVSVGTINTLTGEIIIALKGTL